MNFARPLTFLFGAGVHLRNRWYDSGMLKSRELAGPVVSIGSISVGGAGKTPFTILVGELLKQHGIAFDILSRGYRRTTKGAAIVDPNGSPRDFGDEPLLMAQKLGVPVIVGEDRYEAGLLAEQTHGIRLHLLDDGFQHRRLKRQFDIALVTRQDLSDCLLPAGRLREPVSALGRADAVVVIGDIRPQRIPPGIKTAWQAHRALTLFDAPPKPIAFCGIARHRNFFDQLRQAGFEPVAIGTYRDHHAYNEADIRHLLRLRDRYHGGGFVTTEKDAINLGPLAESLQPLSIAKVEMTLDDADRCLDLLLDTLKARGKPAS
ncbi:MAG TPA: tetraacyldisaccharide 4'-kinase [Terriglobales bacterium]|nr:tetraacyldisaccharide 4'-kinase [Terriglobales bacterium]